MNARADEVALKLALVRAALDECGAAGAVLRGTDWFSWVTAGGSNTVLLTAESGVAEVLVTPTDAWAVTDEIEGERLRREELPETLPVHATPWAEPEMRSELVREATGGGRVISDRPRGSESALPAALIKAKRVLREGEIERYRAAGRVAGTAMTEVLRSARPSWTESQLAGAAAEALWGKGLHPALTLAAGERRLQLYRHPMPRREPLGREAMLVICARGHGLFANLTRFVHFGAISEERARRHRLVREIEADALGLTRPGMSLAAIYRALDTAYRARGFPQAISEHHQGGTTGYLSREVVATPRSTETLEADMAVAWNPSLPGVKIEDTFLLRPDGALEGLTLDPAWPTEKIAGRPRPLPLER